MTSTRKADRGTIRRGCRFMLCLLSVIFQTASCFAAEPAGAGGEAAKPRTPGETIQLFNGRDLSGLYSFVSDTKYEDSRKVFSVADGAIHISGEGFGYLATRDAWRDYRVRIEFKWGKRTDGGKYVRNSGLLLHATGPDGGAGGKWPSCIECQLAQGCVGDLIVIRGKDEKGEAIPVRLTSDVRLGPDKRPRWTEGGEKTVFTNRQLWWNKHDPTFEELLDTRGKDDVESPLGEWTSVECQCPGDKIRVLVNGKVVNECYEVFPAAGKILLQCEGFELFVRKFELSPLER